MKIEDIKKGMRFKIFDHRLFIDDKKTPLNITMKPATIEAVHLKHSNLTEDAVDVIFDHRPNEISKAHFAWGITLKDKI